MWTYNQNVKPPAPFIDIIISHVENSEQTAQVRAKIDSGADITAIPISLIDQLELPITKKIIARGYDATPISVFTYSVSLEIAEVRFKNLRVIASPRDYVILGRDVLNRFYLNLNGPDLNFELDYPFDRGD